MPDQGATTGSSDPDLSIDWVCLSTTANAAALFSMGVDRLLAKEM